MPVSSIRRRNAPTSAGSSGFPLHWLAFLLKIWSASHRCSTARSTAFETPPATDMWAPIRIRPLYQPISTRRYNRGMMRRALLPVLAIAVLLLPTESGAWGFEAHKFIMDRAIALLPQELRPMFEAGRSTLVERSIDPDTWQQAGFDDLESPNHFLDLDWEGYGRFPL